MNCDTIPEKLGYLDGAFRFFHLRDTAGQEHEMHYHEFAKIVLFLSGHVDYRVEGTTYPLRPWDILLVDRHQVHKAVIDTQVPYERVIFYLDPAALAADGLGCDLGECFRRARERGFCLMRPDAREQAEVGAIVRELEGAANSDQFGARLMERACFQRLMVWLNRIMLTEQGRESVAGLGYDPRVSEVMAYINGNLDGELTVDALARRAYMSKYHFMRLFKRLTGYTVHGYVRQKRLLRAAELIRAGSTAAAAAERSGFRDYSTFQRAFKEEFGVSPGEYRR